MDSKALGVKLKTLRLKNGYSQDELAESAGVSLRTVQRMENAEAVPRMDTVKRLFQIFGMSPDEVMDWTQTEDKGYLLGMNFQLTWALVYYLWTTFCSWLMGYFNYSGNGDVSPAMVYNYFYVRVGGIFFIYLLEILMISLNTYRINKGLKVKYLPKINFLK